MVLERFSNFRVFENGFLNGPILIPKLHQTLPKLIQKAFLKTNRFSMSIFHQFWMDSGAQNHTKTRIGMPPSTPRALMERLLHTPGAKKAFRTRFLMAPARFGIDFGRIWDPKVLPKHTKSASWLLPLHPCPQTSASQPPASPVSHWPRRDSRSVNNYRKIIENNFGP